MLRLFLQFGSPDCITVEQTRLLSILYQRQLQQKGACGPQHFIEENLLFSVHVTLKVVTAEEI